MSRIFSHFAGACATLGLLASCGPGGGFDPDLRRMMPGALNTADAAARAAPRPQPDSRGLITFPNSQVAIARKGDTPAIIASRLGLGADELARHNALPVDAALAPGATLVLPRRVAGGPAATGAGVTSTTGLVTDPFAGQGVTTPGRGAPPPAATPATSSTPAARPSAAASPASTAQPAQHVVVSGETAWSIARKYGVNIQDLASWNGLPASMSLRVGQRLLIPVAGQKAPASAASAATTTAPGAGSPTPAPPSAAQALPAENTRPAAEPAPAAPTTDLGATRTAASGSGRFRMPVSGAIIRVYEKGKNDGIDIAAPSGTKVGAAGAGSVAAITRDTSGVPIVVLRHSDGLMTVYTGLDSLSVAKGDQVSAGDAIGTAGNSGFVHFEVRRGFESVDPEDFLG